METLDQYKIFHYRWDIPLLAELFSANGARFISLANRYGISRGVLKASLSRLIASGLVMENPGYGHPLRPEYILTEAGKAIGPFCVAFLQEGQKRKVTDVFRNKWSCPAIVATGDATIRFNALKKQLSPVTSRALSATLKLLQDHDCMTLTRLDISPPANSYALSRKTRGLYTIFREHRPVISSYA